MALDPSEATEAGRDEAHLSYADAVASVTGAGSRFELGTVTVRGVEQTIFVKAPATLRDIVVAAGRRGDETLLVYEDERWSYATFFEHVSAAASMLVRDHGVGRGDRVAIAMRNYPEWAIAFAAITSIGAVSVSLNSWWTAEELAFAIRDSGPHVVIADVERAHRVQRTCAEEGIGVVVVRAASSDEFDPPVRHWPEVLRLGDTLPDTVPDPDDDATILYTSGTTGFPKGAVSTHRALTQVVTAFSCRAAVERARRGRPRSPADNGRRRSNPPSYLLGMPLFHVSGCVSVLLTSMTVGFKVVILHRWDATRALQLIERERVTHFAGVPTQTTDLVAAAEASTADTTSLISVASGGAPPPRSMASRVSSSFGSARPAMSYGMTETNSYGPSNMGADYVERPTSAGRVLPLMAIAIRDAAGRDQPTGTAGEIWMKSPTLIRGYWRNPAATENALRDGWLRSGDIGRLDGDGFLYVEDRIRDMVIRGGENVYCTEVERVLQEHPDIREVAVIGLPHERLGEEVAAVFVSDREIDLQELQDFAGSRLAAFKVPTKVFRWPTALPRNATEKVLKHELRTAIQAGT